MSTTTTWVCATDARADRTVRVTTDGERPSDAEAHAAHHGFGIGFGPHGSEAMILEQDRPRPFLRDEA